MADLQAYYDAQKGARDKLDRQTQREIKEVQSYISNEGRSQFKSERGRAIASQETTKISIDLDKKTRQNGRRASIDTLKFAVRNLGGSSSKNYLKREYDSSSRRDYEKYRNDRETMVEKYANKVNKAVNIKDKKKKKKKRKDILANISMYMGHKLGLIKTKNHLNRT